MPGFNGKGPENEGPRTGRGLGNCRPRTTGNTGEENDSNIDNMERPLRRGVRAGSGPKAPGSGLGRGMGRGNGRGLGRGNRFRNRGN